MMSPGLYLRQHLLQPTSPAPLAVLRIGTAAIALIQVICLWLDIPLLYGQMGLVQWGLSNGIVYSHFPRLSWLLPLANTLGCHPDTCVYALVIIYTGSLLGLLLGKFTRYMALIAWWLHFMLISTGFLGAYGVETFLHIALVYCVAMPVAHTASRDARYRPPAIPHSNYTLALRILQAHLCVIYLASGIEKAMGTQWWNGEAIWQTLMQTQFSAWNMSWLSQYPWIARIICWSTLLVEIGYPVWMCIPRLRRYGYAATVSLHLAIAVFMGLQLFAAMMILLNTAAWGWPYLAPAIDHWQRKRHSLRLQHIGAIATSACCHTEEA
ncbi:HTTM domain-containing protein [Chitinophaga pendula]|uniref:HTTM domain-containing protein n=1 Tax=Chitinophaga TaxID=79328 RepID=UPI0012FD92CE|nr:MULTISPECIES: HTTM domain-containing protein [Chitinophaga]UCJ06048.1 HTTM domain-containing protein [Chitinophaga pendula]